MKNKKSTIEITKTNFVNKGAELMLLAIVRRLREEFTDAELVVQPTLTTSPYLKRASIGLYQKIGLKRFGVEWGFMGILIPYRIRRAYGFIIDKEVDVILDASGFSYSDQFGPRPAERDGKRIRNWKRSGKKVILLPQAFGPFKDARTRNAMKRIIASADLIFARDRLSLKYLSELETGAKNVLMAPDFTNLTPGVVPSYFNPDIHGVCVIPNSKMIDKTASEVGSLYVPFLSRCIDRLKELNAKPFVLLHDDGDNELAKKIQEKVEGGVRILSETDPLLVKGLIGKCHAVISSRFHGLVNALSQGVPCITTGWSHKYMTLLEDYDCADCSIDVQASDKEIFEKIDLVLKHPGNLIDKIRAAANIQKELSVDMWTKVIGVIND